MRHSRKPRSPQISGAVCHVRTSAGFALLGVYIFRGNKSASINLLWETSGCVFNCSTAVLYVFIRVCVKHSRDEQNLVATIDGLFDVAFDVRHTFSDDEHVDMAGG